MGPIIILDKSTCQALSRREHFFLHKYSLENLTPILGMELLGDLAKTPRKGILESLCVAPHSYWVLSSRMVP